MEVGAYRMRRVAVAIVSLLCASILSSTASAMASSHDAEVMATLELPQGDIDFQLETGTLHFFDEENTPFAFQVIDGCIVNDRYWVFGAGFSAAPTPIAVMDLKSGRSFGVVLPPFEPGKPIGTVFEPDVLQLCRETQVGGLPPLFGTATYTSTNARCPDFTSSVELLSEGREGAYRVVVRDGLDRSRIVGADPVIAIAEVSDFAELHLFAEGRTPRLVEGVAFLGPPRILPRRAKLDKALGKLTKARVRRAFEAAKNGRTPQGIIGDLGLKGQPCVYHVRLDFETLGADAYLEESGWIAEGGLPLAPPEPVEQRFSVELVRVDGEKTEVPLTGPLVGSDAEGVYWQHAMDGALVEIVDGCSISGSFWTIAGAVTEEPLQLVVTDSRTGMRAEHVLWTDRRDTSRMADTSSLPACP